MDPKYNNNRSLIEKLKESKKTSNVTASSNDSGSNGNAMKQYIYKIAILTIVVAGLFLLLSLLFTGRKDYDEVEEVMKKAAIKYYKNNPNLLPKVNGSIVEVSAKNLSNSKYMKDLDRYIKKGTCTGKVVVENNDDLYVYIPYLDCGSTYKTTELFREITKEDNIVVDGAGLYEDGNNYIFRGEVTTNYVSLNNHLYRIVKVDENNETVLILQEKAIMTSVSWDDRYNSEKKGKFGINDFNISRIKNSLDEVYDNEVEKKAILSDTVREHMVAHNYCIDHKSVEDGISDSCSSQSTMMKMGLLTGDDYMKASLDDECSFLTSKSCQNYNYLVNKNLEWWLITASAENSYKCYYVSSSGVIQEANCQGRKGLRPVIYLSSKTMYKSGDGTIEKPYQIK